jgi:tetratricopeptide (TPR) repeat protein
MKSKINICLAVRAGSLVTLFLVISLLAIYSQVRSHGFSIFDDTVYVTDNLNVREGIRLESIKWAFGLEEVTPMYWHPLTWISHMIDVHLYGLHPGMHHVINLIFHLLNSIMLFHLLHKLTKDVWKSAVVALLFGVHPLNVESVVWIAERKNVLSTFFWMATILFYARYTEKPDLKKYVLTLIAFLLGLLAKPMLMTLPFVLLLLDFWPLNRLQMIKKWEKISTGEKKTSTAFLILEKLPFLILAASVTYIAAVSMQQSQLFISFASVPLKLRIENALVSYILYIFKAVFPFNLAVFYPFPKVIAVWKSMTSGVLVIFISGVSIYLCRHKPYVFVGWFWFVGTLVPVIGLIQAGLWPAIADRWTYVPMIGIFIILAWSVPELFGTLKYKKQFLAVAVLTVCLVLMCQSWTQTRYWSNSFALFEHTINVTENNSVAQNNLGSLYAMNGMLKKAAKHFSIALNIDPEDASAGNNLARALILLGRVDAGISTYKRILDVHPDNISANKNIAFAFISKKEYKKAVFYINKWKTLQPENPVPYYYIAKIYDAMNEKHKAVTWVEKAMRKGFDRKLIKKDENLKKYLEIINGHSQK